MGPPENGGAPPGGSDARSLKLCTGNEQRPKHTRRARCRSTRPLGPGAAYDRKGNGPTYPDRVISFGKYRGRSFWWLILRRPEYAAWMLREQDDLVGPALKDLPHLEETILDFDDAPIVETCNAYGCSKPAVRCTAFEGVPSIVDFNCSDHEPAIAWSRSWGICNYRAALAYSEESCGGDRRVYREIIARIAEAKGIPLPKEPRP